MSRSNVPQFRTPPSVAVILSGIVSLAMVWLGSLVGWWWLTALSGLALGLLIRPAWLALVTTLIVSGLAWGLPLVRLAMIAPVGRTAVAVESLLGLTSSGGVIIILLTILYGCLLGILGMWVGLAARGLFFARKGETAALANTKADPQRFFRQSE